MDFQITPWPTYSDDGRTDWWPVVARDEKRKFTLAWSTRERRFSDNTESRAFVQRHGLTGLKRAENAATATLGA